MRASFRIASNYEKSDEILLAWETWKGGRGKDKAITEDVKDKEKKKARTNNRKYSERKDEKNEKETSAWKFGIEVKMPIWNQGKEKRVDHRNEPKEGKDTPARPWSV